MMHHRHRPLESVRRRPGFAAILPWLALALVALGGCSSYRLQGVVAEGAESVLMVVDEGDGRLKHDGLDSVRVLVVVDPQGMHPKKLPPVAADSQGRFSLPIDELGAGWMEYQIMAIFRRGGYQSVVYNGSLPSSSQRLYVTLRPGKDTFRPESDVIDDSIKAGKQWMDGGP